MAAVKIFIELPEELVERAKDEGIEIEEVTPEIISFLERRIERKKAFRQLLEIGEQIDQLPDELKPTPEDIAAEIHAYHRENVDKNPPIEEA
jgi:predicted Zn-dependent protease with MMP-like domain